MRLFRILTIPELVCFNSRTPGGVRLPFGGRSRLLRSVSIHAPREGCDTPAPAVGATAVNVSIHAPREGCDKTEGVRWDNMIKFQFTHPGRGATHGPNKVRAYLLVSIHAPREGCDVKKLRCRLLRLLVSIHAPREGCDSIRSLSALETSVSIHAPREGCDRPLRTLSGTLNVSIHAPREGCDTMRVP